MTAAAAILAGGEPLTALRLGASMVALQAGIGATNDVVDAPADAGVKAGKPIPAGLVAPRVAAGIAAAGFGLGILLAAPSGPSLVALAVGIVGIGLSYDLRLKGTAWSWLPFAVGIPLLPVYGWLGATGSLAPLFGILVPTAAAAGAGLAIANALADVERDRATGVGSVATAVGPGRAWAIHAALVLAVVVAAVASALARGATAGEWLAVAAAGALPLGGAWLARGGSASRRERAWELEALGMALLAVAWLAGPALAGR